MRACSQIIAGYDVPSLMEAHYRVFRLAGVIETNLGDPPTDRYALSVERAGFRSGLSGRRGG